jgi:tetratricopeptide (TPR) repeat protein
MIALCALATITEGRQHSSMGMAQTSGTSQPTAKILPGMGNLHHPIATKSPEAQAFFDQGLTMIYAFNFDEAVRSFRRASQLDPSAAMPLWGMALALSPSYEGTPTNGRTNEIACDNLERAKKLAAAGPANERAYIETLSKLFTRAPNPDTAKLMHDYNSAARELRKNYPDDPDAATLYAESMFNLHDWKLWTSDGKPNEDTMEIIAVLEEVLRRWPNHVGANHFYIHALEASPFPERALPSARLLETLVPGAGHLVHMPAHIYMRTGDYAAAVKSNQDATAADREYFKNLGGPNITYKLGYSEHNFLFLIAAAGMDGEYEPAYRAAKQLESDAISLHLNARLSLMFMKDVILVPLRFARWDDVLALPAPDKKLPGLIFLWHYARGCAFAVKGQVQKAEEERSAMEAIYKELPNGPSGIFPFGWSTAHDIAVTALTARIAVARGDYATAIDCWLAEVAVQDKMGFQDPPPWYYPMRESLGATLLRSGKAAEAEKVFRDDLIRNPRNPRSLFGLLKTLEAEHKTAEAATVRRSFEEAWRGDANQLRIEDF